MPGGRTNDTAKIFDYFMQQMQHHLLLEKGYIKKKTFSDVFQSTQH